MAKAKIAVTIDEGVLKRLDQLVRGGHFPNRSQAIEAALSEKVARMERRRLAAECAKLDPGAEQALADEGLAADVETWPAY
ncbi:MAG: ribbon-helix-helix domain-containing protein [Gemmatimonadales bacterium]